MDSVQGNKGVPRKRPIFGRQFPDGEYRKRPGVYAVILQSGKVLVVKTEQGHYFLPGGGIEGDETHEECLKREVLEETGYAASVEDFIGRADQYLISTKNETILNKGFFYRACLKERVHEPEYGVFWLEVEEAVSLLFHDHQKWAVRNASEMSE